MCLACEGPAIAERAAFEFGRFLREAQLSP